MTRMTFTGTHPCISAMTDKQRERLEGLFSEAKHLGLNDWEKIFLTSIETRYKKYGSKCELSHKQWLQIVRIEDKHL